VRQNENSVHKTTCVAIIIIDRQTDIYYCYTCALWLCVQSSHSVINSADDLKQHVASPGSMAR